MDRFRVRQGRAEAAANGSYLQPVPLIEYRNERTQSYVALKRGSAADAMAVPGRLRRLPQGRGHHR